MQQCGYVKRLRNIGVNLKKTVIVDDSPVAYKDNTENAIPIKKWSKSQNKDKQLLEVLKIIEKVKDYKDIRKGLEVIYT